MELLKSVKAREEGRAGVNTATTDVQKQPKQVRWLLMIVVMWDFARMSDKQSLMDTTVTIKKNFVAKKVCNYLKECGMFYYLIFDFLHGV